MPQHRLSVDNSITLEQVQLQNIQTAKFYTHPNLLSAAMHKLGDWLISPVTFFGMLFLSNVNLRENVTLWPQVLRPDLPWLNKLFGYNINVNVLELTNNSIANTSAKITVKLIAILLRATVILAALLMFTISLVLLVPAKALRFIANDYKTDIKYLCNGELANEELSKETVPNVITCVTYNTALLPTLASAWDELQHPSVRATEIMQQLLTAARHNDGKLPEVILLQEVFAYTAMRTLVNKLGQHYPHIFYDIFSGEKSRGEDGISFGNIGLGSGLIFASKFKPVAVRFVKFSNQLRDFWYGGVDALAQKGVLMVVLEVMPSKYLMVCNTHLQSKHGNSYITKRAEQLKIVDLAIANFKQHLAEQGIKIKNKVIFGGDMNISDTLERSYGGKPGERNVKEYKFFFEAWQDIPKSCIAATVDPTPELSTTSTPTTWTVPVNTVQNSRLFKPRRVDIHGVNYDKFMVPVFKSLAANTVTKSADASASPSNSSSASPPFSPIAFLDAVALPEQDGKLAASDHLALLGKFKY